MKIAKLAWMYRNYIDECITSNSYPISFNDWYEHQWKPTADVFKSLRHVKVHLANGDHFSTSINGTKNTVVDYYFNAIFNMGVEDDNLQRVVKLEFFDE